MKILYVEDELSQNIERILKLFGETILSEKQIDELKKCADDKYGADSATIRNIISRSGVLDVEQDFSGALQRIERDADKYDLFIVDRQLATDMDAYSVNDIAELVPGFNAELYEKYLTREGDYLFMRLLMRGLMPKCKMFYFMTAYTDGIKCQEDLRPYMECGCFDASQVLEKGNPAHLNTLCDIIRQSDELSIRHKNMQYFEALERIDNRDMQRCRLLKILQAQQECKKNNRSSVLAEIRNLLEGVVKALCVAGNINDSKSCKENLTQLGPYFDRMQNGERVGTGIGVITIDMMSVGKTIYTICSEYGSHDNIIDVPDDMFYCTLYAVRTFILQCGNNIVI